MKKLLIGLFVGMVMIFMFPGLAVAGGITGGTTRDTTEDQRQETAKENSQNKMSEDQIKTSEDQILDGMSKFGDAIHPGMGTSLKYLIKTGKWAGEQQREAGGVTGVGSTVNE